MFEIVNFAISIALAILSIAISVFAIYISREETRRATELWDIVTRELRGVALRSERVERNSERVFDATMRALISATHAGEQNVANILRQSQDGFSTMLESSLGDNLALSNSERQKVIEEVTSNALELLNSKLTSITDSQRSPSALDKALQSSENRPIAERYLQHICTHPNMLSLESIRATNYEEYVRVLDHLIKNEIIVIQNDRLSIAPDYRNEVLVMCDKDNL